MDSVFSRLSLRSVLLAVCCAVSFELGAAFYYNVRIIFFYTLYDFAKGALVVLPVFLMLNGMTLVSYRRHLSADDGDVGSAHAAPPTWLSAIVVFLVSRGTTIFYVCAAVYIFAFYPLQLGLATLTFIALSLLTVVAYQIAQPRIEPSPGAWRYDIPVLSVVCFALFTMGSYVSDRQLSRVIAGKIADSFVCGDKIDLKQVAVLRGLEKATVILIDREKLLVVKEDCETQLTLPVRPGPLSFGNLFQF